MQNKVESTQSKNQTAPKEPKLKHASSFSRAQLLAVVIIFALVGGYVLWRTFAAGTPIASVEAERMSLPAGATVISDASASGGQAVQMTADGNAASSINLPSQGTSFTIMARAQQCSGSPSLSVSVDGKSLINTAVSSSSWASYTATTTISSGNHSLTINGLNIASTATKHGKGGGGGGHGKKSCTRMLYLDVANFYGDTTPPPAAPTVSLSASPNTVTSGQSSTLTWNSTNATGCTASGAWSGSEAASGSVSTGALNQTSAYTLTCAGSGGSASATATVTVTAPQIPPTPTVYFNPPSQSYGVGSTITIEVRENSGSAPVNAVQTNFSYPADKLTFVSADGSASGFTTQAQSTGANGSVTLARGVIGNLTGDQLIAKVTFKVNIAGVANLAFVSGTSLVSASTNQNIIGSLSADGIGVYTLQ